MKRKLIRLGILSLMLLAMPLVLSSPLTAGSQIRPEKTSAAARLPDPELSSCRVLEESSEGHLPGQPCLDDVGVTSNLLLEHPELYKKIRASVRKDQFPAIRHTVVTELSSTPIGNPDEETTKTVTEYQISYEGIEYSDEIDSPLYVAVVTETTVSDGYVWTTELKTRITTCEKSAALLICRVD